MTRLRVTFSHDRLYHPHRYSRQPNALFIRDFDDANTTYALSVAATDLAYEQRPGQSQDPTIEDEFGHLHRLFVYQTDLAFEDTFAAHHTRPVLIHDGSTVYRVSLFETDLAFEAI